MTHVDVVIPTFNRPEQLSRCLESLAAQRFRDFRVVVVDDGSTPPVSEALAGSFAGRLDLVVLATAGNGGPARARNLGIAAATAEFVAFIDDDVVADRHWLERHLAAHATAQHAASFGPLLAPADWQPTPWNAWEAHTLEREYRRMAAGLYEPTWRQFFTGNAMVRRLDILEAGSFNESFTRAEDIELALRLQRNGARIVFEPRAVGWHYAHRSLKSWLAIPQAYARFDVALDRLYPEIGWLAVVDRELGQRSRPSETVRALARAVPSAVLLATAIPAARAAFAVGLRAPSRRLLSLVYDTIYRSSLAVARCQPPALVRPVAGHTTGGEQTDLRAS